MEPKNIGFSAGAAALIMYYLAPEAAADLGASTDMETITITSLIWSALTAVITPFANVGKVLLNRLTDKIGGAS